jgi:predicted ester cyclase
MVDVNRRFQPLVGERAGSRSREAEVTQLERNRSIVRRFVEAINAQDWAGLDEVVAPSFVRHSHAAGEPQVRSLADLKEYLRRELQVFPDARDSVLDLVAEGDKVAARHGFRGTQRGPMGPYPPSGKVLEASYLAVYRLEGDRIVEAWAEWDNLHGLTQLGHAPRLSTDQALASSEAFKEATSFKGDRSMKRIEYKHVRQEWKFREQFSQRAFDEMVMKMLEANGNEGWDLKGVIYEGNLALHAHFFFGREKPE